MACPRRPPVTLSVRVFILTDSRDGATARLAEAVAEGVAAVPGAVVVARTPADATLDDLLNCDALILGSPNWSGITGTLKSWLDFTGDLWETGELAGKVGACFTAGWSRSAGTEATLLQLLHLLFAHGMIVVGLPWNQYMPTSGSYYGATAHGKVMANDLAQARILGRRAAETALRLAEGARAQGDPIAAIRTGVPKRRPRARQPGVRPEPRGWQGR